MYSIESDLSQQARNLNEFSFTWRINCFRMRGRTGSRTSCTSAALWMACEPSRRLGAIRCVIAFSCQCHTVACLGVVSATLPQGTETQCNSLKSQGNDPGVSLCPCQEAATLAAFGPVEYVKVLYDAGYLANYLMPLGISFDVFPRDVIFENQFLESKSSRRWQNHET